MLAGRIIRLTLTALLALGLGAGASMGDTQAFAAMGQAALSAAPSSGDCPLCNDCAKPCARSMTCSTGCVSPGLTSAFLVLALHAYRTRLAPRPDLQSSSADLRTPTPPPKLIDIA